MIYKLLESNNKSLILFFAGWAFTPEILENYKFDDSSVLIIYDYTTIEDSDISSINKILDNYSQVNLLAWSFGVFYAQYLFNKLNLSEKIDISVALAGSIEPISSNYGIPEQIFEGTLNTLSLRNLEKFFLRISNSRSVKTTYFDKDINWNIENLKKELELTKKRNLEKFNCYINWNYIVIFKEDNIFPVNNLKVFWSEKYVQLTENQPRIIIEEGAHFPFYKWSSFNDIFKNLE